MFLLFGQAIPVRVEWEWISKEKLSLLDAYILVVGGLGPRQVRNAYLMS